MRDEEVEFAVVVIVEPNGAGRETRARNTRLRSHIHKFPVAKIMKQTAAADGSYIDVIIAIVVVIADGAAQSVHFDSQAPLDVSRQ